MDYTQERAELEVRVAEFTQSRDLGLRADLVNKYQWLVVACIRQLHIRSDEQSQQDAIQVGNVGLLQALDRYDPSFNMLFRRYASVMITGALLHHHRAGWRLKTPRLVQELYLKIGKAVEQLQGQLHRSPTTAEIAQYAHVTPQQVLEAIDAGLNFIPRRLESWDLVRDSARQTQSQRQILANIDQKVDVIALLAHLSPLKRRILYMRYFSQMTQSEVSEVLHLSQVQISRLERAALTQLRAFGDPDDMSRG